MDTSPKYDFPWELIADSLSGSLSVESELQFRQWLLSDPDNKEKYDRLKKLWENGMADYTFYQMANEQEAWNALKTKLSFKEETKVIPGPFNKGQQTIKRYFAVAAILMVLIGIGFLITLIRNNPTIYETAYNEQKKITLPDGSNIVLKPQTKIEVLPYYNKTNRTVIMTSGEASFKVIHQVNKTFIVDLGATHVKDIGTSFTIQKGKRLISVSVSSGKVSFVKIATNETRELTAGKSVTFNIQNVSFGKITSVVNESLLDFNNTPLSDVIDAVQKVYGKKIELSEIKIAQKKLTAHLVGAPYNTAISVICKSLNLEYSLKDSVYILKEKK
jgi:ferric-dicitrate binding protein FerR (iron transport regulator)